MDIKKLRNELGMTGQELATKLGVSVSTISRWENEKCVPSKLAQRALATLSKNMCTTN